ncbi:Tol-Pal system beta propeller repeat protein TolB [Actimicrobium sp. CCC2.4]|uniref:Tol-Pal system beta propeller repeat protein TolB n=1 Tax=Actimicrobium sp. CCC2.4 TaxID=3048606 RepID=UPI002AC9779B|nr:Tol-Pal system beta propeller repeat protein TolB [Actimicrobium sp. CCC2.4]MEB0136158.1 Tol-Pal system beta propeller repeat protein TolB [Actimicrobium sp. CCC2.4]WPX32087.1 Tol-Pal system beta propeller repeat protein TolB [Actimicrobium sp. CCC2.4]
MKKTLFSALALLGLVLATAAHAQLRVDIAGVGANQIPIAIATFADESIAPAQVSTIIKADLMRSGYFKIIDAGTMSETSDINYADWKSRGADALVVGSVQRLADGRFDVRYKLLDMIKSAPLSALSLTAPEGRTRVTAHKIADDIYEKLTGVRGAFATRIAYVTKSGKEYRLEVADADGEDTNVALRSNEPIISPAWSPDGTRVAYVSFENKKPVVYVQNLVTRQRTVLANYKGSNSAPSWSPDGNRLAIALSRDGLTQSYIVNADGTGLRRVTNSSGIDTEPQFSADGQSIYFTSDRSGGPQIYKMPVSGGDAQRVTFKGSYNISPRVSPDGKTLAFISRRDSGFQLYAMDLANGQEQRLSDSAKDESPSFSPNSKYIMYATESGRRGSLAVVSVDGRVKQRLTTQAGDIREPTWGPFIK